MALCVDVVSGLARGARPPVGALARWLERAAPPRASGEVTVYFTTDARIRALNRCYRDQDHVTDVLSFGAASPRRQAAPRKPHAARRKSQGPRRKPQAPRRVFLGDVVIAVGRARRQANEAGHTLTTEVRILSLHGLLHLLGFDHETDGGRMARLERALRRRAGLREGLIERAGVRGGACVAEGPRRDSRAGGPR